MGELCWSDDPDYTVGYVACNGVFIDFQYERIRV
ncbi:MAG: 6-carboxyhexanoate--CoA ligase [Veillonella sp.]